MEKEGVCSVLGMLEIEPVKTMFNGFAKIGTGIMSWIQVAIVGTNHQRKATPIITIVNRDVLCAYQSDATVSARVALIKSGILLLP